MIDKVLEERGSRYGEYSDVARTAQHIKEAFGSRNSYRPELLESLDMIANKMARIINGDREYTDNLIDIIGYAQLALDAIEKTKGNTEIQPHEVHPMAPSPMKEPQIETVTLLSEFLKGNGCYDEFVENFDKDFGNILRFDIPQSSGVIIIYIEDMNKDEIVKHILGVFKNFSESQFKGKLFIVEKSQMRIWPK